MKIAAIAFALGLASTQLLAQGMPPTYPPQQGYIPPPPPMYPDNYARPVAFMLGLGITDGGDRLATATFSDGSSSSIKAGGLVYFKAGADWRINPLFSAQGTFGYHGDTVRARNGEMKFERTFVEGIGFFNFLPKHRIGLGLRQTSGANVSSSGAASGVGNINFKSSLGTVLEYEWMMSRNGPTGYGLTFRLVNEKYTPTSLNGAPATGPEVNGNHAGVGFNVYF